MPAILVADSVTRLGQAHAGNVVVAGSHGGLIAAYYAAAAGVRAILFNDPGGCGRA
jgi:broad specificity phosphatase PhoE